MVVFLNDRFVAEDAALVSIFDRGFLYGDGLFETMRLVNGRPFLWSPHLERFQRGADSLKLRPPLTSAELRRVAERLVSLNALSDGVLRLTLSRGRGPRGYSPKTADHPTLVMSLHPPPPEKARNRTLIIASLRIPAGDPLSRLKSCNKLLHVMARGEASDRGADDAILLNANQEIAEATSSNLFWCSNDSVCTPPLSSGALDGITRSAVIALCSKMGVRCREVTGRPATLRKAAGVFLTNSVDGIVEASTLDGQRLKRSPLSRQLIHAYRKLLRTPSDGDLIA
ncbi:MAG: branched-chain amino acid aminotransferase [Verrucomicrobiota bacterium]|jgi:aminodeoxychorismate lyase